MPRKQQGWITFQASDGEREILERFCQQSQRTKTEILRELVRSLDDRASSLSVAPTGNEAIAPPEMPAIQISARNLLKAKIKRMAIDTVSAEIILEIAPGVELVSIITSASATQLELTEGKEVYAVIKSNNVMIAAI